MAKRVLFLVNIFIILAMQIGFCGGLSTARQPAAKLPVIQSADAGGSTVAQLNKLRWAVHSNDAVTGISSLRLVLDVSGQVDIDSKYISTPSPQIVVQIKGAKSGNIADAMNFNGDIVNKVRFNKINAGTMQMIIDLPANIDDNDFRVFTLPGNQQVGKPFRIVVDVNKSTPAPAVSFTAGLTGKIIVLDPGHGGSDSGAVGPGNIMEKDVTLAITQKVKAMLEKSGARVIMTRNDDRDVYAPNDTALEELSARTDIAQKNRADIFVSVHANAYNDRSAGGTATYYYSKNSYDAMLAQAIQSNIMSKENLRDRGINEANFYVIKHTSMPAVLVETAFISNPAEEKLLNSPMFQQQLAQGIVQGIDNFFLQASRQGGSR